MSQLRKFPLQLCGVAYLTVICLAKSVEPEEVTMDQIGFHGSGSCRYGSYMFPKPTYPDKSCSKYTCDFEKRKITIERCSGNPENTSFCTTIPGDPKGKFPYCCDSHKCTDGREIAYGTLTEYTVESSREISREDFLQVTGYWTAGTTLSFYECSGGICGHRSKVVDENAVPFASFCEVAQSQDEGRYMRLTGCPQYSPSLHKNCVKVNDGEKVQPYPKCCDRFMCPPDGRKIGSVEVVKKARVVHGGCVLSENSEPPLSNGRRCGTVNCDEAAGTLTIKRCLTPEEMKWRNCEYAPVLRAQETTFPNCCPDVICPAINITEGSTEHGYEDAKFHPPDVCEYKDRKFRNQEEFSNPCEKWICSVPKKEIKVRRCQSIEQDLEAGCAWEYESKSEKFPQCCRKQVCRYPYFTRFPGTLPPPLPEKEN